MPYNYLLGKVKEWGEEAYSQYERVYNEAVDRNNTAEKPSGRNWPRCVI